MTKEELIIGFFEKGYCCDLDEVKDACLGLLKENQELKKQLDKAHDELYTLKNKYNIRLLNQISENIEPDCEDYYLAEIETKAHKYDLIQNQQKEFINYLEDMLDDENDIFSVVRVKDILKKYKELEKVNNDIR